MSFLYLVLSLDKTIEGINSILPIVSYRNRDYNKRISRATMEEIITKEISRATMVENITIDSTRATMEEI